MRKSLFTLGVCALALSACTSEDVLKEGPQSNAITFRNVVDKNSRSLSSESFGLFYVYGYYTMGADLNTRFNIFTDTPVTRSGNDWTSAINRYWVNGALYSFYAYSCENKHIAPNYGGPSLDKTDGTFRLNYTCHAEGGTSHDLIFASATEILGKESDNLPVPLQFKHILSKVDLKFISEFPEGYYIEISNISIENFQNTGTFVANKKSVSDGTIGEWTNKGYDGNQPNNFKLNTVGNSSTTLNGTPIQSSECYMIPHHYIPTSTKDNPVKIQFNIKVSNPNLPAGNQTIVSNTLVGTWHPNWRTGTQYTYTIRISGGSAGMDEIKFGVGMDDWNNPGDDNAPEEIRISLDYKLDPAAELN